MRDSLVIPKGGLLEFCEPRRRLEGFVFQALRRDEAIEDPRVHGPLRVANRRMD